MVSFLLGAIAHTWPFMKQTTKDKFGADDETLALLEREQCALLAPDPAQRAEVIVEAGSNWWPHLTNAARWARCRQKYYSVCETVRIKLVQHFKGLRMFHCHILEHEGAGMMGQLQLV